MKQYLISSRDVFNKLLRDYSPDSNLVKNKFMKDNFILDSYDFKNWYYDRTDLRRSSIIIFGYAVFTNSDSLNKLIPSTIEATNLHNYISANQMLYYILKYIELNCTNILDGIKYIIDKKDEYNQFIKKTLISLNMFEDLAKDIWSFYPALKWYYSNETKHLYPKELLKQMKDYEKELAKIKTEDFIKEKLFRLR
ncbi:MAG: hypothetical protein ACP5N1_02065 [Candidatus Woesearchaeota archaeon]